MPPFHRPAVRATAVAALALAPLGASSAPALAAVPSLVFAPAHTPVSTPEIIEHGPDTADSAQSPQGTSGNWSGYVDLGSTYTSVTTTFRQPELDCAQTPNAYAGFWVGFDGATTQTVEQTGTVAYCDGTTDENFGWYEMYPQGSNDYSNVIEPGDLMYESVTFTGTDVYTLLLQDKTRGWCQRTVVTADGDARSSAEVIAEAPTGDDGQLPLADFGTATFENSTVDGAPIAQQDPTEVTMVSPTGSALATPSPLTHHAFSVAWQSAA
jgi:Peptidase A4 family